MNNHEGNSLMSAILWPVTLLLAWAGSLNKTTITFVLTTMVSVLAIIHYIIQINKNLKDKK